MRKKKKMSKVCLFVRVSTADQSFSRQLADLQKVADRSGWSVVKAFSEKVSGVRKIKDRPALTEMLEYVQHNEVDKVCVTEISRLGRNLLEVLKALEILHENKVSVYIHQFSIETLTIEGQINPIANMILLLIQNFATLERETLRLRVKSGYDHFRANGGKVGRKEGYKKKEEKYLDEYKEVVKLLNNPKKYSLRHIAKITDTSLGTVQRVKKLIQPIREAA